MTNRTPLLHHFTQTLVRHYDFCSQTCNGLFTYFSVSTYPNDYIFSVLQSHLIHDLKHG